MPVAVDASSPALVRVASGVATTASFTAPAGSLLLAMYTIANTGTATDTVTDSGGLTWSSAVVKIGDGTRLYCAIRWAYQETSAARTVTVNPGTSANNRILQVLVLTGGDGAGPVGATATGDTTTSTIMTQALTSTAAGSMAFAVYADNNGLAQPTAATGTTRHSANNTAETGAFLYQTAASTASGETMTIASTAPNSNQLSWGMVEILPVAAGTSVNAEHAPTTVAAADIDATASGAAEPTAATPVLAGNDGAGQVAATTDASGIGLDAFQATVSTEGATNAAAEAATIGLAAGDTGITGTSQPSTAAVTVDGSDPVGGVDAGASTAAAALTALDGVPGIRPSGADATLVVAAGDATVSTAALTQAPAGVAGTSVAAADAGTAASSGPDVAPIGLAGHDATGQAATLVPAIPAAVTVTGSDLAWAATSGIDAATAGVMAGQATIWTQVDRAAGSAEWALVGRDAAISTAIGADALPAIWSMQAYETQFLLHGQIGARSSPLPETKRENFATADS
jgi:hypothetical protein